MSAAIRCVRQHGLDGTSVAMIAREAGVSRPTLYAYFPGRDEIVHQASIAASDSFVERVIAHARQFDTAAERLVEATLFAVEGIRDEPALAVRFRSGGVVTGPLTDDELTYSARCLLPVVELVPDLASWMDEVSELAARVIISLLTREPRVRRNPQQERAFLYRWWPQALGITEGLDAAVARTPSTRASATASAVMATTVAPAIHWSATRSRSA